MMGTHELRTKFNAYDRKFGVAESRLDLIAKEARTSTVHYRSLNERIWILTILLAASILSNAIVALLRG